jgi:hypothetical protein
MALMDCSPPSQVANLRVRSEYAIHARVRTLTKKPTRSSKIEATGAAFNQRHIVATSVSGSFTVSERPQWRHSYSSWLRRQALHHGSVCVQRHASKCVTFFPIVHRDRIR